MSGEAFVLHENGAYRVFRHVGATHAQRIGPAWKSPRQAIDYAHALDAGREVSPLRATGSAQEYPPIPARSESSGVAATTPLLKRDQSPASG